MARDHLEKVMYTQSFEMCWQTYPYRISGSRRTRGNKRTAFTHWRNCIAGIEKEFSMNRSDAVGFLVGMQGHYQDRQSSKFIMDAYRWYRDDEWRTELDIQQEQESRAVDPNIREIEESLR